MAQHKTRKHALFGLFLLLGISAPATAMADALRIGVSDWPGWVAWYVAERNDYFSKHKVNVELIWFDRYTESIDALTRGDLDANSQTWSDTLPLLAGGHALELILINDNSAGNDALLATPDIGSVAQLRGKRVALEVDSLSHLLLDAALVEHGMTTEAVTLVNMPAADAVSSLEKGLVDAAVSWNPWVEQGVRSGKARRLFDSAQTPGLISDALIARSDRLRTQENRLQFIALMRAWFDTVAFIRAQPREAARIMAEVTQVDADDYLRLLPGTRFFAQAENRHELTEEEGGHPMDAPTAKILNYFSRHGVMEETLDYRAAINPKLLRIAARNYP